jgi:hypothetical protein
MELFDGFLYGIFGGFLAELLGLFKLRHETSDSFPAWLRSPFYWIVTALMILSGGGLVVVYQHSAITLSPILAVNIGASAPLILGTLVSQTPKDMSIARID